MRVCCRRRLPVGVSAASVGAASRREASGACCGCLRRLLLCGEADVSGGVAAGCSCVAGRCDWVGSDLGGRRRRDLRGASSAAGAGATLASEAAGFLNKRDTRFRSMYSVIIAERRGCRLRMVNPPESRYNRQWRGRSSGVEHLLPKQMAVGSNPIARSRAFSLRSRGGAIPSASARPASVRVAASAARCSPPCATPCRLWSRRPRSLRSI